MAEQRRLGVAGEDPLFLGTELLATFHQRPLTVDELTDWMRSLLAIAGDTPTLRKNADQASGVIWALYLTWRITAEEAEGLIEHLNQLCSLHYHSQLIGRCTDRQHHPQEKDHERATAPLRPARPANDDNFR
jgi:hypothetical protein